MFKKRFLALALTLALVITSFGTLGIFSVPAAAAENGDYAIAFNDVDQLYPDGWKAYFSSNPQGGVPFTEVKEDDLGTYYEDWKSGAGGYCITRSQKPNLYNSSNNWNKSTVFTNMGALTYTPQKYKYFDLTIEYKYSSSGTPWPHVVFNQQNTTPEMFYRTDNVTNPTYGEDPISVSPNFGGAIRVWGKKVSGTKTISKNMDSDSSPQWHKMRVTVKSGSLYAAVYDKDGNLALEYTLPLDASYKGGYITLMQNGVTHFRNISIKELDFTSKGELTGSPNMLYNIGVKFNHTPANAQTYGALVWRKDADETTATNVVFEGGNYAVGISDISIYGIKNEFNVKPYVIDNKSNTYYGDVFTASYLEWLLMHKDNTDADKAEAVAQINKILDIYYKATGEAAYEGQVAPEFEALEGTFAAVTPMSVEGDSEITVKAAKPVQGSIVNGKLRVNFDYGTKTGTFGVLVYKSGNAYNPADVSNADADIVFANGGILSVDISGTSLVNYAEQYTFIPYVANGEDVEYGNVIKVSYADFMAYALNSNNAVAKQVATASCELYASLLDAQLCKAAQ
ncbi:MAG: hypothetical protein E7560_05005 [Ruminococcaceae bacterium]|nr:hypothetical protein [Oscillospiraceae bacterium]